MTPSPDSTPAAKPAETESPPRPTYAPAGMAMAIAFTIWGILTHWTMSVAGIGLLAWSLGAWINEVRHEWRTR